MDDRAYGCLFCMTGKEDAVVERIRRSGAPARAMAARQEKRRTKQGKKTKVEEIFLPGYVFFETGRETKGLEWLPRADVIRVLRYGDDAWQLTGTDEAFARWIFQNDGLLTFSKAYREGERIRFASGPLKDLEGRIQKVDKRGQSGQVALEFDHRTIRIWLGFEMIDSMEDGNGPE